MLLSYVIQIWTTLMGNILFFGEIGEGFDSLNKINEAFVEPFQNIRIKHTDLLVDPFQLGHLIPDASKQKEEIDVDVGLEDDWGPMDEELDPVTRDLPYAEINNNVLWVCNLNSVTEEEDLYTIFARFGTVASAEIIRDRETGDSHCYGFIEFKDKEAFRVSQSHGTNIEQDTKQHGIDGKADIG
ncbi:hypothetical protein KY290_010527 [Solanum tuberosum]|uniref:peptidylprolyl isomerase n=1 Tax=Solanum tuberosum TaxID=4113 RepID=A0ABQ7VYM3_SOLTU|nr:hypothetical protein KY290_010527 [Solanum tuberosum]